MPKRLTNVKIFRSMTEQIRACSSTDRAPVFGTGDGGSIPSRRTRQEIVLKQLKIARIKTAKEPGEKHRLEPYFNFGGRKFFNPFNI